MGDPPMKRNGTTLALYIAGNLAGHVRQGDEGALSFAYVPGYSGVPVSLSIPVTPAVYPHRTVRPYLQGLLPDDPLVRADIGDRYGCSGENPFAMLAHIGLDCPGAVQLVPSGDEDLVTGRGGGLVELTEEEVGDRLRRLRERASSPWDGHEGRWSLGGAQSKMALRFQEGIWFECQGSEATTHILKPGVAGYENQALDEYLCLKAAAKMGLPAARAEFRTFCGEQAVVVERFDRVFAHDGSVTRIHQEDLCQALGIDPARKYAELGGPTSSDVMALLATTASDAARNLRVFVLYLLFNYFIGAMDAHAKNYSVLLGERGTALLAPLYDVASIAPYQSMSPRRRRPLRAAMSIGGENRFGMLDEKNIEQLSKNEHLIAAGVTQQWVDAAAKRMAREIPVALRQVFDEASDEGLADIEALRDDMEREVGMNCRRFLSKM